MNKENLKFSVGNRLVDTEIKRIKIKDLHFYSSNPRISSLLMNFKGKLNDEIIHQLMSDKQPEATKTLYRRIKKDGNVNEPLIIYEKQALEGNTRLWALRELYKDAKNPKEKKKWSYAPCRIIIGKLSETDINSVLCSVHIKKKKDWQPFEQACYLAKMYKEEGMSYQRICKLTEFGHTKVTDYIKTFKEMEKRKAKSEEFNYYYETIRQPEVKKEIERGQIKVLDVLKKKIKQGKIKTAKDVRKISTILKDSKAKEIFFKGEADLERAEQVALITNPQEGDPLLKRVKELQEDLRNVELDKLKKWKENKSEINILKGLKQQLDKILNLKALR